MRQTQSRPLAIDREPPGRRSFQTLTAFDLPRLQSFFLAMTFDQRRDYFCAGVSNEAIKSFCQRIDWRRSIVVSRSDRYFLEAVAFVIGCGERSRTAQFSIAYPSTCDRYAIMRALFELTIMVVRSRFDRLTVDRNSMCRDLRLILDEMPAAVCARDQFVVHLSDWPLLPDQT